jgi:hypothetical protein
LADTDGAGITGGLTGATVPLFLITTLTFRTAERSLIAVISAVVDARVVLAALVVSGARLGEDSPALSMTEECPTANLEGRIPAHSVVSTMEELQPGTPSADAQASADFIAVADSMVAAASMAEEVGGDSVQKEADDYLYGEISNAQRECKIRSSSRVTGGSNHYFGVRCIVYWLYSFDSRSNSN